MWQLLYLLYIIKLNHIIRLYIFIYLLTVRYTISYTQAGEVQVQVHLDRVSQSNCLGGNGRDGSGKGVWSFRVAGALE